MGKKKEEEEKRNNSKDNNNQDNVQGYGKGKGREEQQTMFKRWPSRLQKLTRLRIIK